MIREGIMCIVGSFSNKGISGLVILRFYTLMGYEGNGISL